MVWNLRGGLEVRYQEELPACQGSEIWVSGGGGEKENLQNHLLGRHIPCPSSPLFFFSSSSPPPSIRLWSREAMNQEWGFDPVLALLLSSYVTPF